MNLFQQSQDRPSKNSWLPVLAFLGISSLAGLAWWQGNKAERDRLFITTEVTAGQMSLRLEAWINDRIDIVEQLADDWQDEFSQAPNEKFTGIAMHYIKRHSGFQAINWIDKTWHIRIVVPQTGNEAALDKDLHNHPESSVGRAIRKAILTKRISRSESIDLLQGAKGFATYRPVYNSDEKFQGMLNGVFRISSLVDLCLAEQVLRKRFRFAVFETNGKLVYSFNDSDSDSSLWPMVIEKKAMVVDKPWILKVAPTPSYISQMTTHAQDITLGLGLVLALAMAVLLHLLLRGNRALRHEEMMLRNLTQNVPSVIYKAIPDDKFTITFISQDVEELTGYPHSDFVGNSSRTYGSIIYPDDLDMVKKSINQATKSQKKWDVEYRIVHAKGQTKYVHEKGLAVRDEFGRLFLEGFLLDITEQKRQEEKRKEMEAQFLHAQKMEAIGRLAGGIAHDFNNILTGICGNAELLLMEIQKNSSSRSGVEEILSLANRAASLTRQLLAFSRKQVLNPHIISPGAVIQKSKTMIERIIGEDICLSLTVDKGIKNIKIDPMQFDQIILNLAVNARDAMDQGGQLSVSLHNASLSGMKGPHKKDITGDFVCLSVKDTGCGIAKKDMDKIFEPFFSTKPSEKGTGLGLATIYSIVEQNGGTILVESKPNHGATFRVYFPIVQGELPIYESNMQASDFPTGTETILVVEDELQVRNLAVHVLKKCGYKVIEAKDGQSAIKKAKEIQGTIHLLVTDVVMPGMNGKELSERLKVLRPGIKILFMSGHSENIIEHHGLLLNGIDFIHKPFQLGEFTTRVRQALDQNRK